jgi:predicted small secreted protein
VLQGTLLMFVVCKGVGAMKKTTLLLGLIFFVLAGCNTIHGIGKDFEKLGDKIQDASKK